MSAPPKSRLPDILKSHESDLLKDWLKRQLSDTTLRSDLMKESELREQSTQFLRLFREATESGNLTDLSGAQWTPVKGLLSEISESRARQGFRTAETAVFIFSLKQPLFDLLRQEHSKDVDGLATDVWNATAVLDNLGLLTAEYYQKSREDVIVRQQRELSHLNASLEERVRELQQSRLELHEKINDLEQFEDVVVGRELKMIEMEKEIERLKGVRQS
ncbi:MAG: RsbRD N-terminal domain-containing protein [Nitrospirales bacterium]